MKRGPQTEALEARIGYSFTDKELLHLALTHVSAVNSQRPRIKSYERLEFLGDRVLGLVIASLLYERFPLADEGDLSKRLAELVRRESCAVLAESWSLGEHMWLGQSEELSGGRQNPTILGDVAEAVIGAVFLDGGYAAASALVAQLWGERLRTPSHPLRDSKTILQEWAQARGLPTPSYREIARTGPHHDPQFRVAVELPALTPAEGMGRSKRAAEQAAAAAMLSREGVEAAG